MELKFETKVEEKPRIVSIDITETVVQAKRDLNARLNTPLPDESSLSKSDRKRLKNAMNSKSLIPGWFPIDGRDFSSSADDSLSYTYYLRPLTDTEYSGVLRNAIFFRLKFRAMRGDDVDLSNAIEAMDENSDILDKALASKDGIHIITFEEKLPEPEEEFSKTVTCDTCDREISPYAEACPHCGEPMAKRCPNCRSANIGRLTGVDKGLGVALFGVFAANTVLNNYQCNECRTKFN